MSKHTVTRKGTPWIWEVVFTFHWCIWLLRFTCWDFHWIYLCSSFRYICQTFLLTHIPWVTPAFRAVHPLTPLSAQSPTQKFSSSTTDKMMGHVQLWSWALITIMCRVCWCREACGFYQFICKSSSIGMGSLHEFVESVPFILKWVLSFQLFWAYCDETWGQDMSSWS